MITHPAAPRRRLEFALLVLGVAALGFNLRGAITSLPPVFPELQSSLGLSATKLSAGAIVGSLVSVPPWNTTSGSIPLTLGWLALPALIAAVAWLPQLGYRTRAPRGPEPGAPGPRSRSGRGAGRWLARERGPGS